MRMPGQGMGMGGGRMGTAAAAPKTPAAPGSPIQRQNMNEAHMRPFQWTIFKRIMSYLLPYWPLYSLGVACAMSVHGLSLIPPLLVRQAIDVNVYNGDFDGLVITGILYAASMLLFYFAAMGVHWLLRLCAERALRDMRQAVFDKVQSLDMAYFDRTPVGRLITRGSSDLMTMLHVQVRILPELLGGLITLVGAYAIMFKLEWRLFLVTVVASPLLYYASSSFRSRARPAWRRVRRDVSRLTANVAEMISGVRVVQAFAREEDNLERFDDLNMIFWRANMRVARFQGRYLMTIETVAVVCVAALMGWGGWIAISTAGPQSTLKIGMLMTFFMLAQQTFEPVRRLAPMYSQLLHAMASGERVFSLLDATSQVRDKPDAIEPPKIRGDVKFENVSFEYLPGQRVLHDINFEVQAGQTIAFVGHTGCGKTTILSLLNRFYDVSEGRILIDGYDVRDLKQAEMQRQTGLILQENFLFNQTVMANLKYARPDASDEYVHNVCRQLGCDEIFSRLPQGYYTQVGERGDNLSAGQRQLVSICRAMVADPRILVMDEATSSVDTATEMAIQYALDRLFEQRTAFIVAHRLSTVRRADRILVMDAGRIIERGTHSQLVAMDGIYAKLHQQFMKVDEK